MNLAGIVSLAGIFSTFFGFMFGSVFGFEDIIEAKWIRPINHMTTLPFIGKLNTVFIVSIAFGMGIILISMIFHIINGIRAKDTEATWFDANGVAGADILRGSSYLHRSFHDRSLSAGWNRSCSDVRSTASSDRTERAADEQDQKENRKNGTKQSNVCHPGIL